MSLINKMLQDLEARNDAAGNKPQDIAHQDLRPVIPSPFSRPRRGTVPVLVFIAVAATGALVWLRGPEVIADGIVGEGRRLLAFISDLSGTAKPSDANVAALSAANKQQAAGKEKTPQESMEKASPSTGAAQTGKSPANVAPAPVPAGVKPKARAGSRTDVSAASSTPARDIKATAPKTQTPSPAPALKPRLAPSKAPVREDHAAPPGQMEKTVKPLSPEEEAEGNYQQAATQLQQGRRGDAENSLRAALAANPAHAPARELLAGLALQNGRTTEAQQLLEEGLQKNPKHYSSAQLLARLYVDQGAEQKALALMESAREAGAADPAFLAFLGALYQRAGRHADAVAAYTKAVNQRPDEGHWWLGLGISLEAEKNFSAASDAYTRAQQSGALDQNLQRYVEQRLAIVKNK